MDAAACPTGRVSHLRGAVIVRLSAAAAGLIEAEAPASADGRETGGILLGHDLGDRFAVTVAGDPGPHAVREADRFLRDLSHAEALSDAAYDTDGSVWLGEWHTHPGGPVVPSPTDLATYLDLLADEDLGFRRVLSLIVTPCQVHGWAEVHVTGWSVDATSAHAVEVVREY